jgi:hypothetical protein
MASTSAAALWRLVLLIGAPLAFAIRGTLHLVPGYEPTAGSDFDHVVPHWSLWTGIHVLQLVIISLLAFAVATLTPQPPPTRHDRRLRGPARRYWPTGWARPSRSLRSLPVTAWPNR